MTWSVILGERHSVLSEFSTAQDLYLLESCRSFNCLCSFLTWSDGFCFRRADDESVLVLSAWAHAERQRSQHALRGEPLLLLLCSCTGLVIWTQSCSSGRSGNFLLNVMHYVTFALHFLIWPGIACLFLFFFSFLISKHLSNINKVIRTVLKHYFKKCLVLTPNIYLSFKICEDIPCLAGSPNL